MNSEKPRDSKVSPAAPGNGQGNSSRERSRPEPKASAAASEKSSERAAEFTTISGYPIRRLYTQSDLASWNPESELGAPGASP